MSDTPAATDLLVLDSTRLARWYRRAWWSNRFLIYAQVLPAVTAVALVAGYPIAVTQDRLDIVFRPTFLYGFATLALILVAWRHIGRIEFQAAPVLVAMWSIYFGVVSFGPLQSSDCVRDWNGAACSPIQQGMVIENVVWLALSLWFVVAWWKVSTSSISSPGSGEPVRLARVGLEAAGRRSLLRRIRPSLLTLAALLPAIGVVMLLRWKGYPALQEWLFPATRSDEGLGLEADPGLLQIVILAAYHDYGASIYIASAALLLLDATILLVGLRLARRLALRASGRFWSQDRLPSILLLRSFSDDQASVHPTSVFKRLGMFKMRLEEALGRELVRRGTLVAVGQPGEVLPKLGAYRLYLDDQSWQPAVLRYMDSSAFIVVIGGTTRWVRWELDQIAGSPNRSKLIYVVPPGETRQRKELLGLLADALRLAPAARSRLDQLSDSIITVSTRDDGQLCLCTGLPRRQSDVQLATYLAMVAKGAADQLGSARATS